LFIQIGSIDESEIASKDKAKIEKEAEKIAGKKANITYFDASLFKQ
jgi:hypothetical protein